MQIMTVGVSKGVSKGGQLKGDLNRRLSADSASICLHPFIHRRNPRKTYIIIIWNIWSQDLASLRAPGALWIQDDTRPSQDGQTGLWVWFLSNRLFHLWLLSNWPLRTTNSNLYHLAAVFVRSTSWALLWIAACPSIHSHHLIFPFIRGVLSSKSRSDRNFAASKVTQIASSESQNMSKNQQRVASCSKWL